MSHLFFREAVIDDLEDLVSLANLASWGVTNLPKDRAIFEKKIDSSIESFRKNILSPHQESYIFVLEEEGKVVGVSQIQVHNPPEVIKPYFLQTEEHLNAKNYPYSDSINILQLIFEMSGSTELCGLFLHPDFRKEGAGKMLSQIRFLFMKGQFHRFTPKVFADLRGVINDDGSCPLWDFLGKYFCPVDFEELNRLYINYPEEFWKILPKHPIYTCLLPFEAQKYLGLPHPRTLPAQKILMREGFLITPLVHPMDGGARLEASKFQIKSVNQTVLAKIEAIEKGEENGLISTFNSPFRACNGTFSVTPKGLLIEPACAKALNLKPGELCHYLKL